VTCLETDGSGEAQNPRRSVPRCLSLLFGFKNSAGSRICLPDTSFTPTPSPTVTDLSVTSIVALDTQSTPTALNLTPCSPHSMLSLATMRRSWPIESAVRNEAAVASLLGALSPVVAHRSTNTSTNMTGRRPAQAHGSLGYRTRPEAIVIIDVKCQPPSQWTHKEPSKIGRALATANDVTTWRPREMAYGISSRTYGKMRIVLSTELGSRSKELLVWVACFADGLWTIYRRLKIYSQMTACACAS